MAYGIEELSEMKVTGPVQGGDMVAKPNEMPVGAAALLAKMQKKNTPGLFKLPEADKEMPKFMKVAAEGVEEQNTANLEEAEILRIMGTYGVGPEEARRIYDDMIYGYERDEAAISPTDWRSILKMIESGMSQEEIDAQLAANQGPTKGLTIEDIANLDKAAVQAGALNFLGEQPEVTVPVKAKSHEDSVPVELAYITDAEKDLLVKANIHGTMDGTPNPGPGGVQSLDDFYTYVDKKGDTQVGGGGGEQVFSSGAETSGYKKRDRDKFKDTGADSSHDGGYESSETVGILPGMAVGGTKKDPKVFAADTFSGTDDPNMWGEIWSKSNQLPFLGIKIADAISAGAQAWEEAQVDDLISKLATGEAATGWGNLLYDFKNDPERMGEWFDKWGDKLEDPALDNEWADMKDKEKLEELIKQASATGGDEFMKKYNPEKFYGPLRDKDGKIIKESAAEYQKRMREKGVTAKELAEMQMKGKLGETDGGFTKANTMMIEEGRRRLEEDRRGSQSQDRGSGGGGGSTVDEEVQVAENVDVDPRAGAFNVGGTMKYKDDLRTGGKEMDVPLGSRFDIDKSGKFRGSKPMTFDEAIKYATVGGHSQLEPFQEYLTRRRKELGEQPDEWFDEEGNVIFSRQA